MPIYHCSTKPVSRAKGQSSCAASAYRAGEELEDERTGVIHNYEKKQGVAYTEIISNLNVPIERRELWNLAEKTENRKDARTAREWVIALPHELDSQQRQDLAKNFAQVLVDRYGVVADLAIHAPSQYGNDRNHHAHILVTTRQASLNAENGLILNEKADIELSNQKRSTLGLDSTQNEIKAVRELWADLQNQALEKAGIQERVDHRSFQEQGKDIEPTIHEGKAVTQLRRKGIDTEISLLNDRIKQDRHVEPMSLDIDKTKLLEQGMKRVDQMLADFKQRQVDEKAKKEQEIQIKEKTKEKDNDRGFSL